MYTVFFCQNSKLLKSEVTMMALRQNKKKNLTKIKDLFPLPFAKSHQCNGRKGGSYISFLLLKDGKELGACH